MPQLSSEYLRGLREVADLNVFAADGGDYHFYDRILRPGQGRDEDTRAQVADELGAAAACLRLALGQTPFILSLDVQETDSRFSRKSWSPIHAALSERAL